MTEFEQLATEEGLKRASQNNANQAEAGYNAKWFKRGAVFGYETREKESFTLEQIDELFFSDNYGYFDEFLDYRLGLTSPKVNKITFKDWFEQFKKK
jgi:hypothetical protein